MKTMLDNYLQELDTLGFKLQASLAFGKLPDGHFVLVCDYKGSLKQDRGGFLSFFRSTPIAILFKKKDDLTLLDKVDTPVDTEMFKGFKAQKIFRNMKILSKGKGTIEARFDTVAIRKIKLKPFKDNSVLVIRLDNVLPSKISKTTHELPANVYYRAKGDTKGLMKEDENINEIVGSLSILIGSFVLMLSIVFGMLGVFISTSKLNKKLSKRLKDTLKDGKDWKVYVLKEDIPNAFCIATPRMFIHTGLQKILTEDEVFAVMLHEAGHINNKDIWKKIAATGGFTVLLLTVSSIAGGAGAAAAFALLYFMRVTGLEGVIFARTLGRRGERMADSFAVKHGYGEQLASALSKLDSWITTLRAKRPCGRVCRAFYKMNEMMDEHPPLKKRVEDVLKEKDAWETKNFKSIAAARMFFSKKFKAKA
jgi:hypothetical protein